MTRIADLNAEKKQAIKELQLRMKHALSPSLSKDPTLFYRFLEARDFNVDKAEKMLRKHIEWRKVFQIDTILEDFKPKEFFVKHLQPNVIGHDKDGELLIYIPIGKMDAKDVFRAIKRNDLLIHIAWVCQKIHVVVEENNEETGRNANQVTLIFDLDEVTLSNVTNKASLEIMLRITHLTQDNFPERLKAVYVINAPNYFTFFYAMLRSVMSKAMQEKFQLFGQNGWKELFQEKFDLDSAPAFLGGKRTDPDGNPRCNTFIRHAGKTPPIYYLTQKSRYFEDPRSVETLLIQPMERKEVYVDITENGSRIEWRFLVKGKDIGFGLFLKTSEKSREELIPIEKFSTTDGTEEGYYKCKSVGKYVLLFDNSYSWMSSKEIEYSIMLV